MVCAGWPSTVHPFKCQCDKAPVLPQGTDAWPTPTAYPKLSLAVQDEQHHALLQLQRPPQPKPPAQGVIDIGRGGELRRADRGGQFLPKRATCHNGDLKAIVPNLPQLDGRSQLLPHAAAWAPWLRTRVWWKCGGAPVVGGVFMVEWLPYSPRRGAIPPSLVRRCGCLAGQLVPDHHYTARWRAVLLAECCGWAVAEASERPNFSSCNTRGPCVYSTRTADKWA